MLITWKPVDNVNDTCRSEHQRRGLDLPKSRLVACAFWNFTTRTCTIFTKKNPTMNDVGHEIRHCFQGDFH